MPANTKIPTPVPQLGIDKSQATWVIDGSHAVAMRDVLLDQLGYARRRGPFALVSGSPAMTYASPGLTQVSNPAGGHRVAVLEGNGTNQQLSFLAADYLSTASSYPWPHAVTRSSIVAAAPAAKRGTYIGVSTRYDSNSNAQSLGLWRGANNTDTGGGTTITATRGSKTVTGAGSFNATVTPGAFLFAAASTVTGNPTTFIGVVQSISGATVTLEEPALASVTIGSTPDFRALRGVNPRVTNGTVTCSTTSATVNGGATRFKSQALNSGVWQLFRARDLAFIGEVSSVTSNIQLTLTANAAVAMDNEFYIAIQMNGDFSVNITSSNWTKKLGFITASYVERQFYANSYRVGDAGNYQYRLHYSSVLDPEAVDVSEDGGSWIPINSTSGYNYPIIGLLPTFSGLLIFKQNEVLLLTGDDPSNFSVRQLLGTDGTLGPGSIVQHDGGAMWAGKRGVYIYDGVSVDSVSASLGDGWQQQMIDFNPETYRAYAFKHRNHYVLAIESTVGENYYTGIVRPALVSQNLTPEATGSLSSYDVNLPATIVPGNRLVITAMCYRAAGSPNITAPANWQVDIAPIAGVATDSGDPAVNYCLGVFSKVASIGDGPTVTLTLPAGTDGIKGECLEYTPCSITQFAITAPVMPTAFGGGLNTWAVQAWTPGDVSNNLQVYTFHYTGPGVTSHSGVTGPPNPWGAQAGDYDTGATETYDFNWFSSSREPIAQDFAPLTVVAPGPDLSAAGWNFPEYYELLADPTTNGVVTGTSIPLTQQTFALNLYSGAWTALSNFMHRGAINLPAETSKKTWAILTNSTDIAKLVEVESMFTATGSDDVETSETSTQVGPRLYIEYRRSGLGDNTQLAYWKDWVVKGKVTGGELQVRFVPDFGTDGYTIGDTIPSDTDYDTPKTVRCARRSTHMGIRVYEPLTNMGITEVSLGPGEFTVKPMRHGRDRHANS